MTHSGGGIGSPQPPVFGGGVGSGVGVGVGAGPGVGVGLGFGGVGVAVGIVGIETLRTPEEGALGEALGAVGSSSVIAAAGENEAALPSHRRSVHRDPLLRIHLTRSHNLQSCQPFRLQPSGCEATTSAARADAPGPQPHASRRPYRTDAGGVVQQPPHLAPPWSTRLDELGQDATSRDQVRHRVVRHVHEGPTQGVAQG
jgi:hypothetical protein